MRRLIRSEKLKLMEKAKTVLIVLLLFLCVFSGYRILRLYNAQTNDYSALWGSPSGSSEIMENGNTSRLSLISDTAEPALATLNTYSARKMIDHDSQAFQVLTELSNQLMIEAYRAKSEQISEVSVEEWQNALNSDSVYFKYPIERFVTGDIALLGEKSAGGIEKISRFSEVLLTYDKNRSNRVLLYIADDEQNIFLRVTLESDAAKAFNERASRLNPGDEKRLVFAWELELDKKSQDNRVALDSMLLIPVGEEKTADISISVPKLYMTGLNFTKATDLTLGLVNAFNYNPNTIRQYVGKDNSIMFVGETGSLNLHPDGLIEYKALDAEDGVPLSTEKNLTDIVHGLCTRLEKIMRIGGINVQGADYKVKLTAVPRIFRFEQKTEVCFDYFVDEKKVEFAEGSAITATLQKGKLVELKLHLADIEIQGKHTDLPVLFDAIDRFCAENSRYSTVKNACVVYPYQKDTEGIKPEWKIEGAR